MEDCTISVTPANNSVSLITNAGIMGGIIAGELRGGSYMYDCTVQGGRAVNNSVVGVSGLGGEGLYLGALVGSAENSQIEYCRVLPKSSTTSTERKTRMSPCTIATKTAIINIRPKCTTATKWPLAPWLVKASMQAASLASLKMST